MTEWWDEDPELLGATLGLLAAWDGGTTDHQDLSPSCSPPSPPIDSDSSSPKSSAPKRSINVSRERRKQELQFLRNKEKELQTQLRDMRDRRDALLRPHYRDAARTQLATVAPVWENMAIRQFQSRKRSEVLNAKLKTMLSAQLRVAQDLIRAIQAAEARSREVGLEKPRPLRMPIDVSQRMSEEEQLARLEVLCETWKPPIQRCTMAARDSRDPLQFFNLHVVEASDDATVVEMLTSSVLPYEISRVEETMWSLHSNSAATEEDDDGESFVQEAKAMDNLAIGVLTATTKIDGARGTFSGKFVTKRLHPTPTQVLIASHMQSEASDFGNQLDGITTFEESWVRLIDARELGHTQLSGTLTVVQHTRRERIVMNKTEDSVDGMRNRMEAVSNIMMTQIREEIEFVQQLMEDILMTGGDTCSGGPLIKSEPF